MADVELERTSCGLAAASRPPRTRARIHVYRVLFVFLTVVLLALDVDSAFNGHGDLVTIAVSFALLAAWFGVYARLWQLAGRPR